jgi:winged helix DNA-binding protein
MVDENTIRAFWAHRQGLDGSLRGKSPAEVLERTGWSRSVGGAGPYFTLFSRAGLSRKAIDAAVAALEIHELPAARGCTYVVPASDFALALRVGEGYGDQAQIDVAKKCCGVTDDELDHLCQSVLEVLDATPLDPRELKDKLGDAVRNLGPEGKKKGVTTTLPLALGRLQTAGEIRRVPINGRLDQQRYRYARWYSNPRASLSLTDEEAYTELARRFFRWIGPARLAHFQWIAALSQKAARAAIEPLGLVTVNSLDERLMFPDDREVLMSFEKPTEPHYVLTSTLDNITHLRRDVAGLLSDSDQHLQIFGEKGEQPISGFSDLPHHPILDRGQLIGLWEYDPETQSIVWTTFTQQLEGLHYEVARTEALIRDELGDMRSFSLDSPESRKPRIAALRKLAAQ